MDRTSLIGLSLCIVLLVGLMFLYPAPPPKPVAVTPAPDVTVPNPINPTPAPPTPAPKPAPVPVAEELTVLENPALKVTLTSSGAAIREVELKLHQEGDGNVILNRQSHSNIMSLFGWPGADTASFQKTTTPDGVSYLATLPGNLAWQRTYAFDQKPDTDAGMSGYLRVLFHKIAVKLGQRETVPEVYTLDVNDTLTNSSSADVTLPAYTINIGRAQPLRVAGHYQPGPYNYPGSGWYTGKFHLTTSYDFEPGFVPLIGIKTHEGKDMFTSTSVDDTPLKWIGVENQFFTVLLTPVAEGTIQHASFFCFNQRQADGSLLKIKDAEGYLVRECEPDIEATASFPDIKVPAGKTVTLSYQLFAGPKDFNRLDALGANQGEMMNYGWFSILIVPMLTVLRFWYLIFNNYGAAIILLTLMIKAITWPLQSIANHSGKRMQALTPKLKELQAKYKETPEKLQSETFALYREYGVNPFGGCLPALVQMPVFFSLYFMLQNAVELRGQHFLWVHDLTQPDSVFTIPLGTYHFSLNILPIMVTGLTMVMMRMTPQIGDPTQAKIAQWMPLIFLFIFYNFAAALSLYYVINNCVSIIQIYRNLRKPLPELKRIPRKKTS